MEDGIAGGRRIPVYYLASIPRIPFYDAFRRYVYAHLTPPTTQPDRDPPITTGSHLLNAWHRTTSAPRPREMLKRRRTQWKSSVVEGGVEGYVLHRVLYPQVHVNGVKKKKKKNLYAQRANSRTSANVRIDRHIMGHAVQRFCR